MHRPLTLIAAVGAAVAPTLLVATASDAAQAALSCPAMALAGQPFTIDVTIDVGTTALGAYSYLLRDRAHEGQGGGSLVPAQTSTSHPATRLGCVLDSRCSSEPRTSRFGHPTFPALLVLTNLVASLAGLGFANISARLFRKDFGTVTTWRRSASHGPR